MPRTFTLRSLLVAITLFCILSGLAWNFPEESLAYLLLLALFFPTVIVCQVLVYFSRNRLTVLTVALLGASFGYLFVQPWTGYTAPPRTVWLYFRAMLIPMAIFPPLGALLLGGAVLADELNRRTNDN